MRFVAVAYLLMFSMAMFAGISGAQVVGTALIHAPAVLLQNNTGVLTVINLTVTTGSGNVTVSGPAEVGNSTINSSIYAAMVGASMLGKNYKDYNFYYTIRDSGANVSGPSAGTAMTLLAMSSLSGIDLLNNFTVTGVIEPNGTIGEIGGVFDKIGAAKANNMSFMMVPFAGNGSIETEIYYLASRYYGIEVIPIYNVSMAFAFATGKASPSTYGVKFNLYSNYSVSQIPDSKIQCMNSCNQSEMQGLANFTTGITRGAIANVSSISGFKSIAANMSGMLNQSQALVGKGYFYTGADVSFQDYINAFMFENPNLTKQQGLDLLDSINYYCSSLTPPQLTNSNYNYVLNGELRQLWGNVTISSLISQYNSTAIDSDGILRNIYSAGEAYAWCQAANYIYTSEHNSIGAPVSPNQNIDSEASSVISSELSGNLNSVPSVYLIAARQALDQNNYALALLDSAYIKADEQNQQSSMTNAQLYNSTVSMVNISKFGSWATQFSAEALFYINESRLATSNMSRNYLLNAYGVASLAEGISNDTQFIKNNLENATYITSTIPESTQYASPMAIDIIIIMLIIIIVLLVAILASILALSKRTSNKAAGQPKGKGNRRQQI